MAVAERVGMIVATAVEDRKLVEGMLGWVVRFDQWCRVEALGFQC